MYYLFLLEDGLIVGEQEVVQVLQLAELRVIMQRNLPNFLQLLQDDAGINAQFLLQQRQLITQSCVFINRIPY